MKGIKKDSILDVVQFQYSILWPDDSIHPFIIGRFSDDVDEFEQGGFGIKERMVPVTNGTKDDNIDGLIEKIKEIGIVQIGQLNAEGENEYFDISETIEH